MKHAVDRKKFSRTTKQRKALFLSLVRPLLEKGMIITTLTKAKATRRLTEKLVTTGKKGDVSSRRRVQSFLRSRKLTNRLVDGIAPLFLKRPGGYLRIIHLSQRKGDNAPMAKLEFIEFPPAVPISPLTSEVKKGKVKTTKEKRKIKMEEAQK